MEQAVQKGLNDALLDRLRLTEKTIDAMHEGLCQTTALPNTTGEMGEFRTCEDGLQIGRTHVSLGVVGIVYESRPDVTIDAVVLCLRPGNVCILCGGSEAFDSNMVFSKLIMQTLAENSPPTVVVSLTENTDRESTGAMLQSPEFIDVIIPHGGKSPASYIAAEVRMPVIKHLDDIYHAYIGHTANAEKTVNIAFNVKILCYGICNIMEALFAHQSHVAEILFVSTEKYVTRDAELCGRPRTLPILPQIQMVFEEDRDTEYLAPILSVKIVDSLEETVVHTSTHGSHHIDSIVTESYTDARIFLRMADSISVMVNVSTRFADGFEYGLGVGVGISADRIHVRGLVGLHGLTSQKWIMLGDGQARE